MPPQFIDYDAISDRIYSLGQNIVLNFTVKLARKDKDGCRVHFHKEFQYPASSYIDTRSVISIKRNYDYYFSIEDITNKDSYIQIRLENMIMLKTILQQLVNILVDESNWMIKDKKLILKKKYKPILLPGLPMNKWLTFEPITIEFEDGSFSKGIRITLSDYSVYVDMTIDKFMGLTYLLDSYNMPIAAMIMINYLDQHKFGTSLVVFDNYNTPPISNTEEFEGVPDTVPNRTIPKRNKSFFDKSDELDNL